MPRTRVPDVGDLVWPNFTPNAEHEQAGRRRASVLSPAAFNRRTGGMLCRLDGRTRCAQHIGTAAPEVLEDVRAKIRALVG